MKKLFIFIFGVICGLLLNSITDPIKMIWFEPTTAPVLTKIESSHPNSEPKVVKSEQTILKKNVQIETKSKITYVKYWQSKDGFKFKDVGIDGVQKTYVWNNISKRWDDTGCIGSY